MASRAKRKGDIFQLETLFTELLRARGCKRAAFQRADLRTGDRVLISSIAPIVCAMPTRNVDVLSWCRNVRLFCLDQVDDAHVQDVSACAACKRFCS